MVQDAGVAKGPIGRGMKDVALGVGYLVSAISVALAQVYGVLLWLGLIYGAGLAVGLLIAWADRRWRFLRGVSVAHESFPVAVGAAISVALLVLLHSFIHPEFSWSNVLFFFERH